MPIKSSIQIHNELLELKEKVNEAQRGFNSAEGDAKDAYRDQIKMYEGEQKALNEMLSDVLDYEDKVRKGGGVPLAAPADEFKPQNLAQAILGDPKAFDRIDWGSKFALDDYQDFKLVEHKETNYDLPEQYAQTLPKLGIYNTLPKATTKSDSVTFFEADPEKLNNAAATWTPGNAISMSGFAWKQRSFHLEQIANGVPVLENNLRDYGQLSNIINVTLRYMQELAKGAKVVNGPKANTETGIVGILEHDGIQKFAKGATDTIADCAYKMANDVFLKTGFIATHVAMHPYVAESVMLEKDKNGRYINQMVNGKLWALNVVQDLNLATTTTAKDTSSTTYGMMAYWPNAATFFTKMGEMLEVGLVNDQFLKNEQTIRINGQYGLQVTFPGCFSYLADTGVTGR